VTPLEEIKIRIEKVNPSHLDDLQTIGRQTFSESYSSVNTEENIQRYLAEKFSKEQVAAEVSNPNSEFYFAKIDKQVIGYIKLNFGNAQTVENNEDGVEIERIYVSKSYQGKRVGQELHSKALEIAKTRKAPYIWLGVWEKNPGAIRFYERHGFMSYGNHTFFLGGDEQTDILMKLKL